MPCFNPLHGWESKNPTPGGKHQWVRSIASSNGNSLTVPCGQCIGCRIDRSKMWAIRCTHEASLHSANMFLTLTYAPEHLPRDGSLQPSHFTRFMKRYRKHVEPTPLRYFHCGEYGEQLMRPHYHALIFGHQFDDLEKFSNETFTSATLQRLWPYGFSTVGQVTYESAAYVARYVTKKITGAKAAEHYQVVNKQTGELHQVKPEYVTMSRRPGIAKEWFNEFHPDVYNYDYCVIKGKKQRAPRYYDELFEGYYPDKYEQLKQERVRRARLHEDNNTTQRLKVREEVLRSKLRQLKRNIE